MTKNAPDWMKTLHKGPKKVPPRICIYGTHGIGKSTLAAKFPNPIFISTEDGLNTLDVVSFPKATKYDDVVDSLRTLIKEEHDFKTLVIDSVDWLVEPLITAYIEGKNDPKDLAYGKGNVLIAEEFRSILQGCDVLREKKGMNIVLIAHAAIARFENPMTEAYDQYRPKLPTRANALLQEWADILAFAAFKVMVKKVDAGFGNTKARGITTGDRLLHLVENPAYLAKNRYSAPDDIEMSFDELSKIVHIAN